MQLPEASYYAPFLLGESLQSPLFLITWIVCTGLLILNYCFPKNPVYNKIAWSNYEGGKQLKWFLFFLTIILSWLFTTYTYNFYYGQSHLLDRLILLALSFAVLSNPLFLFLFFTLAIVIISQFHYPTIFLYSWTDKMLYINTFILFLSFFLVRTYRNIRTHAYVFATICMIASTYFYSGIAKLWTGANLYEWLFRNKLYNLLISGYVNGWTLHLGEQTILAIAQILKGLNFPLLLFVVIVELAAILVFFNQRLTLFILAGLALLHTGIFLVYGLFFWKYILLCIGLIVLLITLGEQYVSVLFSRKKFILSTLIIVLSLFYFAPSFLGWIDSRMNQMYVIEAETPAGTYEITRNFMSPYDIIFDQNRLYFLSNESIVVGTYGSVRSFDVQKAIEQAGPEGLEAIKERYGRNYYDPAKIAEFDRFMITCFRNLNDRGHKNVFFSSIAAPTHTYTFSRNPYAFQAPVHAIHINYVETYYDGKKIHHTQEKRIHTINITTEQIPRTHYTLTQGEKIFKTLDVGSYALYKIVTLPDIGARLLSKILDVQE